MHLYKNEIKNAMNAESDEAKKECVQLVMTQEILIQEKSFLRPVVGTKREELEKNLLELRKIQYAARYEDYLRIILTQVRQYASPEKIRNWELLSGTHYWTTIAAVLLEEKHAKRR